MKKIIFIILISLTILSLPNKILCNDSTNDKDKNLYSVIQYFSNYIASDNFKNLSSNNNDLAVLDSLYLRFVQYYDGDYSEALLALTFTTLPFNNIPLIIPILDVQLDVPLPSASDSIFRVKTKNLPRFFFFNSPKNKFGDKDKLAHFFGNAFLSYNISFFNFSKFLGIFVELFEQSFKVNGSFDYRDIQINHLGELFGVSLNNNESIVPSQIFALYSLLFYIHSST